MTANHVHGITRGVGRTKLWHENINLTLPKGAKDRMDAALAEGEDRLDMIRDAIERELKRRAKLKAGKRATEGSE